MRLGALAALLLVAGCGDDKALPPERPDAQVARPQPVVAALPKRLEFAGRWAVRPDMCASGWWDFGGREIVTAGELACSVVQDERTESSARLELTCLGEGMPINEVWQIDGTPERISVVRNDASPVTLVKCPAF